VIRDALPADVPVLLELIRELARYEREPDAVQTDERQLHESLFGPDPKVWALIAVDTSSAGAEVAESVVGCAIWFVNYSTWTGQHGIYLEDLVVRESARGGGHGRALLARLAAICLERGYPRLDWAVLDWNEPAWGFYRALGAEPMTEWTGHRVSGDALAALAARA
jgi:GNAT superfamily N-acetyltransferase